jgi:ATP-dependent Clp protease ATP-binding subunit ClpX
MSLQEDAMIKQKNRTIRACSFCGKDQNRDRRLIAGPDVAICNECVRLCSEILQQDGTLPARASQSRAKHDLHDLPSEVLLKGLQSRSTGIQQAEEQLQEVVRILRQQGITWARIGEALGVSRQSAWERYSEED